MQTIISIIASLTYWAVVLCMLVGMAVTECFPRADHECASGTLKTLSLVTASLIAIALYGLIFYLIGRAFDWWRQRLADSSDGR